LFLQVLVNLLRNAADASPRGGAVDLEVKLSEDQAIVISVTDDGPGVDESIGETAFAPFVTTKSESDGAGLGLAIAAEVVETHGGSIRYERADKRGARFIVSMPLVQ